jgi:NAD(P)H-dependent FMN reductase
MILQQRNDDVCIAGGQAEFTRVWQRATLAVPQARDDSVQRCGWLKAQEHGIGVSAATRGIRLPIESSAAKLTDSSPQVYGSARASARAVAGRIWGIQLLNTMKVLGISGSLRAASMNSSLLRAAVRLTPPSVTLTVFEGVGQLPLFNPDLEAQPPPQVTALRQAVAASDALLFASPEYAHGVTGAIKNTLDWLVSFEPFVDKPVAVLNASPRAHHADAALREILKTMSANIVESASISIPLLGAHLTVEGMTQDPALAAVISGSLLALHEAVVFGHPEQGPAFPFT